MTKRETIGMVAIQGLCLLATLLAIWGRLSFMVSSVCWNIDAAVMICVLHLQGYRLVWSDGGNDGPGENVLEFKQAVARSHRRRIAA